MVDSPTSKETPREHLQNFYCRHTNVSDIMLGLDKIQTLEALPPSYHGKLNIMS